MSTMVTELAVPLRGSKLHGASCREVRALLTHPTNGCKASHLKILAFSFKFNFWFLASTKFSSQISLAQFKGWLI